MGGEGDDRLTENQREMDRVGEKSPTRFLWNQIFFEDIRKDFDG